MKKPNKNIALTFIEKVFLALALAFMMQFVANRKKNQSQSKAPKPVFKKVVKENWLGFKTTYHIEQ